MRDTPQEKMKKVRLRHKLSTLEFGKALGYKGKPSSIEVIVRRFECGDRTIPVQARRLLEYMDAYGIPPHWYNGGK